MIYVGLAGDKGRGVTSMAESVGKRVTGYSRGFLLLAVVKRGALKRGCKSVPPPYRWNSNEGAADAWANACISGAWRPRVTMTDGDNTAHGPDSRSWSSVRRLPSGRPANDARVTLRFCISGNGMMAGDWEYA